MPIYAYRCESCGFAKDVLQKISDPLLTDCPSCGAASFQKQVTAAGFQLKGSGWYVTDFRDGKNTKTSGDAASTPAADAKSAPDAVATPAASPDAAPASAAASSTSPAAPAAGTAASSAP